MAKVNFVLKDPKAIKETRICAILTDGREVRFKFYSEISVKPNHWSKKDKKVLSANSNASEYNKRLETFSKRLINTYGEAKERGLIPTFDYIKDELKPKQEAVPKSLEFWIVWDKYLDAKRSRFKKASFTKFKQIKRHLQEFEKEDKLLLQLDSINIHLLERLQNYYFHTAKLSTSTTAKYIDNFKMFLNWSREQGYTDNAKYKTFRTQKQPDRLKVILSASDIEKIEKAGLKAEYLINARELLILSTLTGLRYSDYSRISKEHVKTEIDGSKTLHIRQEKTMEYVSIPLVDKAVDIINKLLTGKLRAISNQKLNDFVKKVCELAKVEELHEVFSDRGKLSVSKKVPKYELVTTHTGRRTFATNLLLKGVQPEVVMKYTGHKTYQSFKNYVNIPKQAEYDMVKKALLG